jgi:hypothetical protein
VALCKSPCRDELNAFWDDALGTGTSPTAAITAAGKLGSAPAASASNTDVHAWIVESFEAAKASVYKPPIGPGNGPYTLTAHYKSNAKGIAKNRAAAAGARLARLLNDNLR